jgi:hypothetical protein
VFEVACWLSSLQNKEKRNFFHVISGKDNIRDEGMGNAYNNYKRIIKSKPILPLIEMYGP